MKYLIAAAALAALAVTMTTPAFAGAIENSFGNTLTVTQANGGVSRYQFNADNTYSMTGGPNNATVTGTWARQGAQFCMTPQGGAQNCVADPGDHAVGESWTYNSGAANAQPSTMAIVRGR